VDLNKCTPVTWQGGRRPNALASKGCMEQGETNWGGKEMGETCPGGGHTKSTRLAEKERKPEKDVNLLRQNALKTTSNFRGGCSGKMGIEQELEKGLETGAEGPVSLS